MPSAKPALFFALQQEAQPFISHYSAKQVHSFANIKLYKAKNVYIIITGIGTIHMATAVGWFAALYAANTTTFWNIGTAASIQLPLQTWYTINGVHNENERQHFYPDTLVKSEVFMGVTLFTASKPLDTTELKNVKQQLVDMEGIAFAKAVLKFTDSSTIQLLKYASDNGTLDFYKNKNWQELYAAPVKEIGDYIGNYSKKIITTQQKYNYDIQPLIQSIEEKVHLTFTETVQVKQALLFATTTFSKEIVEQKTKITEPITRNEKHIFLKQFLQNLYYV